MAFPAATKLSDYNLYDTVKITPLDIQNTYQRLYSPMNVFLRHNGSVNKQNVQIGGTERPYEGNQSFLNSPCVMVWCTIAKEKVIEPYFFENENVNGEIYRNMLIRYAFPRFASLRGDYIFH